jgi:hypothetical protein
MNSCTKLRHASAVLLASACLVAATAASADVFRCKESGKIVYSDRPCVGETSVLRIAAAPAASTETAMPTSIDSGTISVPTTIAIGMSKLQLLRREGMPFEKTAEKNSRGVRERWSYCRDDAYTDIYLDNDVVTKIARRAASVPAGPTAASATTEPAASAMPGGLNDPAVESRTIPAGASLRAIHADSKPR